MCNYSVCLFYKKIIQFWFDWNIFITDVMYEKKNYTNIETKFLIWQLSIYLYITTKYNIVSGLRLNIKVLV